jgi:hypothetical protein
MTKWKNTLGQISVLYKSKSEMQKQIFMTSVNIWGNKELKGQKWNLARHMWVFWLRIQAHSGQINICYQNLIAREGA